MRTLVAAIALLVLALALRLPHGELAEWKGDEGVQFARARALAREGVLPERGLPTTDGPRLPVHFIWILAAPLVVADDPEAVRVGMALLASGVIVLVFVAGRRDLGARTALAWALLLAVLPDEVRRGRWSWNPNLIPPLAALALLLLVRARRRPQGFAGAGLLAFATLLPLVHYSLVGLGAVSLVAGLAWTKDRRAFLAGSILGLLLLAPHVVIESRTGFKDTRAAFAVAGHRPADPEREALAFPRLAARAFELENYARAASTEPLAFEPIASLATRALLAAGVLLALASLARRRLEPPGLALLAALGAWAPFLVLGLPARHHYVQTAVPALAYLAAFAVTRARVLGLLLAPVGWASVLAVWAVLASAERGLVGTGSDYDIPLGEKTRACRELLARDLELVHYPRFEYLVLLEACWRELPPGERDRFALEPKKEGYWDVSFAIPRPRHPRGRAALMVAGAKVLIVELP
ncbi:MAG: glycosyltransferase family 39 protein [Planctomycetota bacterium]